MGVTAGLSCFDAQRPRVNPLSLPPVCCWGNLSKVRLVYTCSMHIMVYNKHKIGDGERAGACSGGERVMVGGWRVRAHGR